ARGRGTVREAWGIPRRGPPRREPAAVRDQPEHRRRPRPRRTPPLLQHLPRRRARSPRPRRKNLPGGRARGGQRLDRLPGRGPPPRPGPPQDPARSADAGHVGPPHPRTIGPVHGGERGRIPRTRPPENPLLPANRPAGRL
ncbi:MAG: hypothetical protein AVDCRST_MAG05-2376, partial [uncultured Rubrobacteraceae bacterium]